MNYLNLGCGQRSHPAWTNVDFESSGPSVIAHNLLHPLPFADSSFSVVYHAHVLEHFSKSDANNFMRECFRVLQSGGIVRVVVPDLEQIVREYLNNLTRVRAGDRSALADYDWSMLELYDQAVRGCRGGEMKTYLTQPTLPNQAYILSRVGQEAAQLREAHLAALVASASPARPSFGKLLRASTYRNALKKWLFSEEVHVASLGRFRLGGEIHQWMYDAYSLSRLLLASGFSHPRVVTAFESQVNDWESFALEASQGIVYKPDSLFMEAKK